MGNKNQDTQEGPQKQTRYERVKEILNEAAGDACPSYQGYERFWELPLEEFLEVTIYGVRMIAEEGSQDFCEQNMLPAASSHGSCCESASESAPQPSSPPSSLPVQMDSCCGPQASGTPEVLPSPGRGAASGLIKGLKGQFPFDGTQFPRLPWGGKAVSSSDILFIQNWIDDGCPATDEHKATIEVTQPVKIARAQGHEEHPLSTRSVNEYRAESGKVKFRKNIECLTEDELTRFRRAVRVMHCYDKFFRYDDRSFEYWADIHANNCQHGWEQFLTWHRVYLYYFEQQLQDIDPTVTLPYWDWPMYRQDVLKSIQDQKSAKPLDNGVIPKAYRCFVNQDVLDALKEKISPDTWMKLKNIKDTTYNSGNRLLAAAKIDYNDPATEEIMTALQAANPLWHRRRWPGGNESLIFEAYPTEQDVQRVLQLKNFYTFGSGPATNHFFGAVENIHNLIHNFSGGANPQYASGNPNEPQYGDMVSAGTTAKDPIFWGHHSNVDRLWAEWQSLHPGGSPDDPTDILAPWTLDVKQSYSTATLGYEYMKNSHLFETDSSIPITRFKSAKAGVHPAVLANHKCADIRLHKVQYSVGGGAFIRVFLNQPDANVDTPTRGNDHFVAQIATFSGEACIGGPGHCDVPPPTRRKFDLRSRHHKTPGNFRVDATEAIERLSKKGETDFQINLVVMDIDGTPKPNALWLDGVSLNFKD